MSSYKEYQIIEAGEVETLNNLVNQHLKAGWELFGKPFIRGTRICQGLIKTTIDKRYRG